MKRRATSRVRGAQSVIDRALGIAIFDPNAETELHSGASATGLAGMLMQRFTTNRFRLVYAVSRRTSKPERHYHSSKLELLAMMWAVARFHPMLANITFTMVTDCQALCHLSTQKTINPQIIRWNDFLSEYDYRIVHRPRNRLVHVDALSRAPVESSAENDIERRVMALHSEENEVRLYQYVDDEIRRKKGILEKPIKDRTKHEMSQGNEYKIHGGIAYDRCEGRVLYVIPSVMRKSVAVARTHNIL